MIGVRDLAGRSSPELRLLGRVAYAGGIQLPGKWEPWVPETVDGLVLAGLLEAKTPGERSYRLAKRDKVAERVLRALTALDAAIADDTAFMQATAAIWHVLEVGGA